MNFKNISIPLLLLLYVHKIRCKGFEDTDFKEPEYNCRHHGPDGRIVGGDEARSHTWYPSVVHLEDITCGATILNSVWLITAAHCRVHKGALVVAGNPFKCVGAKYEQRRQVIKTFNHEEYEGKPVLINDIALLQINKPFTFTPAVQPVRLVSKGFKYPDNTKATVVGWGMTEAKDKQSGSQRLREVDVPSVPDKNCSAIMDQMLLEFHPGRDCYGYMDSGGKDACRGDSGGPLYGTQNGLPPSKRPWQEHILIGIVSFGRGCGEPESPGVYTGVQYYLDWINRTMEENPWRGCEEGYCDSAVSLDFGEAQLVFCLLTSILVSANLV